VASAPPGIVLGIDSASDAPSLALVRDSDVVASHGWEARETMSRELLTALDAFLRRAEVGREALAAIAVNVGPGQYGALRTGVATAQGLALALDIPLAGVGRLEAEAYAHLAPGRSVAAVHNAGRSGYAWAVYEAAEGEGAPRETIAPRLDDASAVAERAPAEAQWCGEVDEVLRAALVARFGAIEETDEKTGQASEPRALSVVRLAALHEAFGDPARVDVVYLRPPPITRPNAQPNTQPNTQSNTQSRTSAEPAG
jgi:tRNA threonylcarbamoyl adenosine modification protein YeaZ